MPCGGGGRPKGKVTAGLHNGIVGRAGVDRAIDVDQAHSATGWGTVVPVVGIDHLWTGSRRKSGDGRWQCDLRRERSSHEGGDNRGN